MTLICDPVTHLMGDKITRPRSHDSYLARKYVPELDGLRALSVLVVISVHMHDRVWHWLAGWQGVTVFFVLSGYLITTLAVREEDQRGCLSLTAFYIRRCFRIFPLYYLVLGLYCLLIFGVGLNPEKRPMLTGALPWYLLYLQEVPYFYGIAGQHRDIPFYQSWSLGIEEKFYLIWPLLAFVLWRGSRSLRLAGALVVTAAFALMLPAFKLLGNDQAGSCLYPYYHILLGCLLALLLHDPVWFERLRRLGTLGATCVALAVFLTLYFLRPHVPDAYPALGYACDTLFTVATGAFLIGILLGDGPVQRVLRAGPLVFVGKLSYGIYLIHILCLNVAQRVFPPSTGRIEVSIVAFLLACVISVAAAWVLNWLVETPLIEIGRRWSKRVLDRPARRELAEVPVGAGR